MLFKKNEKLIKIRKETLFAFLLLALALGVAFGQIWHMGQMAGI